MLPLEFEDALHSIVENHNKKLLEIVETNRSYGDQYYIIFVARQDQRGSRIIRQRYILSKVKPPMMLASMVYFVDQVRGELSRLWCLPGDWLSYPKEKMEEPHPEIVASIKKVGEHYYQHAL